MATRRDLLLRILPSFAVYALLGEARIARAFAPRDTDAFVRRHDEIAAALAAGELAPTAWQDEVEALAREVDLDALAAHIARAKQQPAGRGSANDPEKRYVTFLDANGERSNLHFGAALFRFDRGNVITPHGHRWMASAHLVLEGRLRVRTFERAGEEEGVLVLRDARDDEVGRGAISTMSSERHNVHWFVPRSERALTFDVVVSDLERGQPSFAIQPVDPVRGERLADGSLRAPIIGFSEASARYTSDV